ncbi:MAG: efflux RND transporter permease subunit [Candidatus Peribacteraceae bacterium]|nr:efflux RND transporter permease subunit [Candidatus Peribacteraceae bacterium]
MTPQEEKAIAKTSESFWGFFVNNWRVAMLVIITLFTFGLFSLFSLPLESDPEVKIPFAMVTTAYPGASPADIEKLVTDRMEEKLQNLENLEELTSASREGISSISVEFEADADLEESIRDLRDEVETAKSDLPEDATDPVVTEIRIDDQPIITVSILSNLPPRDLKNFGEDLQDELEAIAGVSEVLLSGIQNEEVQVIVDIQKLEGYSLSLSSIVSAISANHIDSPIGSLLVNDFYYTASLKGQFASADELLDLPIASLGGQNILLRDVAEVREVFAEKSSDARVYTFDDQTFRDSVTLQVKKKTGANIIEIAEEVKDSAENFRKEKLPPSAEILITNDWSKYIYESVTTLGRSGAQTIAIIFIVLFLALGLKEGLMVGFSIPLIFLISFIFLRFAGETLNDLVLFSLVLSLGLVVDTSIVIMEGVYEGVKTKNLSGREAALLAIKTYRAPLISGTLTTVAVFIPMAMMTGIMGEFVKHIPITVSITLLSSLFIALFILSAIAARVFRDYHKRPEHKKDKDPILSRWINPLRRWYLVKIRRILSSKKRRRSWIIGMIIASLVTVTFPIIGILKVQMFPSVDFEFFTVNIERPVGTVLEETAKTVDTVEQMVMKLPEVDNFVTILGGTSSGLSIFSSSASGSNKASITVNLLDESERMLKSWEIADQMRDEVRSITEADVEVSEIEAGPPTGAPVELRVIGENIAELERVASDLTQVIESIEGTRDVDNNIEHGTGEFHFKLKRDRLNFYGVSAASVAGDLRSAVFGNDSVKILRSGEETPIVVSLDFRTEDCKNDLETTLIERRDKITICRNSPRDISQIQNLLISTPKGLVPVSELATIELNPAVTAIHHRDTETIVSATAYVEEGFLASEISAEILAQVNQMEIPDAVRIELGGETEDVTESFASLGQAMIFGLFLIVLILVLQFNSYRQPFIITFTLPLALIGVFTGLTLLGRNFSFPGFIGIVALLGVVVNDAIVLIDRINNKIRDGMEKLEAIVSSAGDRLQPIILTTVTTACGVLPLVWADEMWIDLALSIFFGIIFATVLTLVMVPIFYNALENEKEIREVEHLE